MDVSVIFTVYLEMAEGVSQWTNVCLASLAILSEKGINFDKPQKPLYWAQGFSHISESQCDPNTKCIYTTSAVISVDQKEVIFKKFMNPFLKKVNVKVNMLTLDLCQRTTPF